MQDDTINLISNIDPIDDTAVVAAWSQSTAKSDLLREITSMPATEERNPRYVSSAPRTGRRWVLAAGVAALATFMFLGQGLFTDTQEAFAIKQLPSGALEINVVAQLRDGEALAAELRSYGIDATTRSVPASPGLVGQVSIFTDPPLEGPVAGLTFGPDGSADVFNWSIDPFVFKHRLVLEVYTTPESGQPYENAQSVFEPGEALDGLNCAIGEPMAAAAMAPFVVAAGMTPQWFVISTTDDPSIYSEAQVDAVPTGEVFSAYPIDSNTIRVSVLPLGETMAPEYRSPLAGGPCTPERAARWS